MTGGDTMASDTCERLYKKVHLYGSFAGEVIKIVVGGGEGENAVPGTTFAAHKNILCNVSPFFKAACKLESMKPEDRLIKLPNEDAEAVQAMLYWMYHDEIGGTPEIYQRSDPETSKDAMKTKWGLVVKLFILARNTKCHDFEMILSTLFWPLWRMKNALSWASFHTRICPHRAKESPLRKLMLKCVRQAYLVHELEMVREKLCSEFIFEMVLHCYVLVDSIDPRPDIGSPCEKWCLHLHEHGLEYQSRCSKLRVYEELSEDGQ